MRRVMLVGAICLAGCGGGGGHAGGRAARTTGGLTWFAATTGPPPSVAVENRHAGTSAWRLADRDTRGSKIDVYVGEQDLLPGTRQQVFVRARGATSVRLSLLRIGWYGGRGARLMMQTGPLPAPRSQPACVHSARTGVTACGWRPTLSFEVPRSLPSGVYIVEVAAGSRRRLAMFVLEAPRAARLVAHISTATYEAYNDWGGDSLYPGGRRVGVTGTGQGVVVSYDRPYATLTGAGELFARDVAMIRFLEQQGYPLSYVTSTSRPGALAGARVLLDIGHSEYWSAAERTAWTQARDGGVSLAFFSSDTLAWKVSFNRHVMVGYKEHARLDARAATGAFADNGAALTGSAYTSCITPRRPAAGRAEYHYYPWSPVPSTAPPWLLAGSGLSASSRVPMITGYELDARTAQSPAGVTVVGSGRAPCQSGHGVAQSTLYTARSGALVFATGTLGWGFGVAPLADPGADVRQAPNPGLVRVTRNVIARMLAR